MVHFKNSEVRINTSSGIDWKKLARLHMEENPHCTYEGKPHFVSPSVGQVGFYLCSPPDDLRNHSGVGHLTTMKIRNTLPRGTTVISRIEIRYRISRVIHKAFLKVIWKLPKKVVYWSSIRVMANATTGEYRNQIVPDLTAMEALGRWDKTHKVEAR